MARILIAEDEEGLRTLVARALAQDGHAVTTANDGAEALDVLTREHGAFELLLTDIRMPIMDGIALALATARDHPHVTILLMTGYADQRERASGLEALIHDVISKPFSLASIRTAVRDALAAAPPGRCTRYPSTRVDGTDAVSSGSQLPLRSRGLVVNQVSVSTNNRPSYVSTSWRRPICGNSAKLLKGLHDRGANALSCSAFRSRI